MRSRIVTLIAAGLLVAACHNTQQVKRGEQNYDVVQEGQTDSVTSTISGPGETPPPATAVPLTGTNADTTTAFTLPATTSGMPNASMQQSPTIAGTIPPMAPQTTTRPRIVRTRDNTTITNTNTSTVATDTVAIQPTQTDTAQQPPEENRKKNRDRQQQPPPSTSTDQQPPPPATDTTDTTQTPTTTSKPPQVEHRL
jgi:hypothetical protein